MLDQLIVQYGKNFHVAIFSKTRIVINVRLCMMVPLIGLYLLQRFVGRAPDS